MAQRHAMVGRGSSVKRVAAAGLFGVLILLLAAGVLAADDAFVIGPDDVLAVSVWDNKELDQVVTVRPDGKISLPLVGEVQAGGRTVADLTEQLNKLYSETTTGARATVSVREIRSRPIYFMGGVVKPGPIQLTQDLSLLQGISLAGGLTPTADLESASVMRGDKRIPVDFVKLVQKGDVTQNIKLQPGDTIVIPQADVVYVQGEVKTPGQVKFTRDLTILRAIAQAGGFTQLAAPNRVTLLREEDGKKSNTRVKVSDMIDEPSRDIPLRPNDIIIVPQRLF
jgi:polysaccharide export outer membrane protein